MLKIWKVSADQREERLEWLHWHCWGLNYHTKLHEPLPQWQEVFSITAKAVIDIKAICTVLLVWKAAVLCHCLWETKWVYCNCWFWTLVDFLQHVREKSMLQTSRIFLWTTNSFSFKTMNDVWLGHSNFCFVFQVSWRHFTLKLDCSICFPCKGIIWWFFHVLQVEWQAYTSWYTKHISVLV